MPTTSVLLHPQDKHCIITLRVGVVVTHPSYNGNWSSYSRPTGNLTIPDSVVYGDSAYPVIRIDSYAFDSCNGLTSVTIPNSVTEIGVNAFKTCYGLTSVTIPNSVTIIEPYAFYGCIGLTSVTIPNSVTRIGNHAFCHCGGLTSVILPNSITTIEDEVFIIAEALPPSLSPIPSPPLEMMLSLDAAS